MISGNSNDGVRLQRPNNTVTGNYIGTNAAGTAGIGNTIYGVEVTGVAATNNTIGGNTAGLRNVISGSNSAGVISQGGAAGTKIQGNYIGTDVTGSAALANGNGVIAYDGITIGGANSGEGNLISGNTFDQVQTNFTETVAGNVIGLNAAGTAALVPGTTATGVEVDGAGATIGGATVAARNVISGQRDGIIVRASGDNAVIRNNYIGTDVSGTAAVGDRYGIWVDQATGVDIGGPASADRNVISGQSVGVLVMGTGANGTQIRNNYIGTDKTGSVDLGNSFGVELATQSTTTQVGAGPAQGNLISGNGTGVYVASGSTGNTIDDNDIGPDALGNTGIGNSIGIEVNGTGTATVDNSYSNTIAFNTGRGVVVSTTTGQATIRMNDIYSNGGLGIDLDPPNGVDTNDADGRRRRAEQRPELPGDHERRLERQHRLLAGLGAGRLHGRLLRVAELRSVGAR